ncbi:hypothetical protein C8J56DRAFT_103668 [Mycena floridula]|nr:hypothetical protein C8J56DRAFT_103668 [Mycena floridula]
MDISAQNLKNSGVETYKKGNFKEAISFFKQASDLEPNVPVYLSNLSAVQFEIGDYAATVESCAKALNLLPESDIVLRPKVVARHLKALGFLVHDKDEYLASAIEAVRQDAFKSSAIERQTLAKKQMPKVNERLSDLPRYRASLEENNEYLGIGGHDLELHNSVFGEPYHFGKDNDKPEVSKYVVKIPEDDATPFEFAALFCGIGDGRHLYSSLIDAGLKWPEKRTGQNSRVHLTINDIHPSTLARDLIFLFALEELATIDNTASERTKEILGMLNSPEELSAIETAASERTKEILLMLNYLFWAQVMPPLAARVLDEILFKVRDKVLSVISNSVALDMGWLYVEADYCQSILESLEWWCNEGKTIASFEQAVSQNLPMLSPDFLEKYRAAVIENIIKSPGFSPDLDVRCREMSLTTQEYLEWWQNLDYRCLQLIFEGRDKTPESGLPCGLAEMEHAFHCRFKILVPPEGCGEPPEAEELFKSIRHHHHGHEDVPGHQHSTECFAPVQDMEGIIKRHVKSRWSINYTAFDRNWLRSQEEPNCPRVHDDPFRGTLAMVSGFIPHFASVFTVPGAYIYGISATFFSLAATGFGKMKEALKIEVVLGDGYEFMDRIRLKTISRPTSFPIAFDRIHGSSVSGYCGQQLTSFTTALPLLKTHNTAYFTECHMYSRNPWLLQYGPETPERALDFQLYTATGAIAADIEAAFAVKTVQPSKFGKDSDFLQYYPIHQPIAKVSNLLSRNSFAAVSTACFLRTVLPGTFNDFVTLANEQVREVVNVNAFFRALETWKRIGYPPHILADLVNMILDNRLERSAIPHEMSPANIANRTKPLVGICTVPFQAEFEVAAALWEPRLFPILSSALPAIDDIRRYSIHVALEKISALKRVLPNRRALILAFGLPEDMDATCLDLRKRIIGASGRSISSIQLLSTFKYEEKESVCTFLMSRARGEALMKEGYEVGLIHVSQWRLLSSRAPCTSMIEVGDVDNWDNTLQVPKVLCRTLTRAQLAAWKTI